LDEVEEAMSGQDWEAVGERARSVLRLDPENQDALSYLAAAERDQTPGTTQPAASDGSSSSSRSRLEQYIPKELLAKLEGVRRTGASSGERLVVTMLFCDVTGSTSAAESLDPEEWSEIMNGAFEHLISPVYRYEGTVARLMGDAILAFFDAPIAHEDDPQRAVLAGLAAVDWVVPFGEDTPADLIAEILPDVLVKGGDYKPEDIAGAQAVWSNGGKVEVLSFSEGRSTSAIIAALRKLT